MSEQVQVSESASILVVDDNPLIQNVLKSLFSSAQYRVYTSSNGREAIDILDKKAIDVIVCDVMMPEMDGYDLHGLVRENAELCHIPFVFLTALGGDSDRLQGKSAGADDYIVKPFNPSELLAIVQGKVKRSRGLKELSEQRYDSYRKRVIHTLSHEFRTPLVAINTGTELLLEREGELEISKISNLLQAIQRGGQRLEKLVNDFMLLQQIEAGIAKRLYDARHRVLDITSVVSDFISSKQDEIVAAGFSLELKNTCSNFPVDVYEPHLLDVFNRLISNATKFFHDRKEIEVQIFPLGAEVAIEIRDRGIGIDPERVQEAIDVFGQIDRDKLEQQGGGLGLAIASRYAAIQSGRLEFEKRADGGSIARLLLPISQPQS